MINLLPESTIGRPDFVDPYSSLSKVSRPLNLSRGQLACAGGGLPVNERSYGKDKVQTGNISLFDGEFTGTAAHSNHCPSHQIFVVRDMAQISFRSDSPSKHMSFRFG